jgi:DNA methyltransferase 1-associated protein 1
MKLPPSVGLKKTKAIEQILEKLQIGIRRILRLIQCRLDLTRTLFLYRQDHRPIATEAICEQFNDLRSDIVLLYELNQAISNYEFELQSLKHRYEALYPGKSVKSTACLTAQPPTVAPTAR